MKEATRWELWADDYKMAPSQDGDYVEYADYNKLYEECRMLLSECAGYRTALNWIAWPLDYNPIQSEVEIAREALRIGK